MLVSALPQMGPPEPSLSRVKRSATPGPDRDLPGFWCKAKLAPPNQRCDSVLNALSDNVLSINVLYKFQFYKLPIICHFSYCNIYYYKYQRRQSCLKTGTLVVGPGLKTGGSWVLKVQQTEAHSTGLRLSFPDFLLNIHYSFYF